MPVVEYYAANTVGFLRKRGKLFRLGSRNAERLFAKHILSVRKCRFHFFIMTDIGRADIDDIDFRIVQHGFVVCRDIFKAEPIRFFSCAFWSRVTSV